MYMKLREVWEFEVFLASSPRVWINEAMNLRYSCEALFLYDQEFFRCIFDEKRNPPLPGFVSARVERMLMGFSLENLIKAILLKNKDKLSTVFSGDGRLSWGKDGHNLLKLFGEADVSRNELENTYLGLWQMCAIWAGRYPIPINELGFPARRKPVATRGELFDQMEKKFAKARQEGDPLLGVEIDDLFHGDVGQLEKDVYRDLFNKCLDIAKQ